MSRGISLLRLGDYATLVTEVAAATPCQRKSNRKKGGILTACDLSRRVGTTFSSFDPTSFFSHARDTRHAPIHVDSVSLGNGPGRRRDRAPCSAPESATAKAIAAGEFQWAKGVASSKDDLLADIATAQSLSGETSAAAATLRDIESASAQSSVITDTWSNLQGGGEAGGGAGGGAFADFDSLMNLIQTTVMPDTWEALGGNSTMAPYPQGVYIDPSGTIRTVEQGRSSDALANLTTMLAPSVRHQRGDWRDASALRVVSLRRLKDAIAQRRLARVPLGDAMLHLAGLTEVKYVVLTQNDILIAAPVGGIDEAKGWFVDVATGRTTLRTDHLARCFAATSAGLPFGCTIDPTPAGMQAAAAVSAKIRSGQLSIGTAADELRKALGMQRVEVFGAAADTSVALLMVEADRHMKQLAMGDASMPDGVKNYLDIVDDLIDFGPPNGLLLRLWFTSAAQKVRSDSARRVFEISGSPIRLSGENQRALADGGRGKVTVDIRSQRFVTSSIRTGIAFATSTPFMALSIVVPRGGCG